MSARFERSIDGHQLVVTNMGPCHARLIGVEVLDPPIKVRGYPDLEDIYLLKGGEYRMRAYVSWDTPTPLNVKMVWVDSRGEQSREQWVGL